MAKKEAQPLIAKVMVSCWKDGVRTDVMPGEPLPDDLPEHDVEQLKLMGSIEDPDAEAAAARDARRAANKGNAEFQAARSHVLAADESTRQPVATGDNGEQKKD